MDSHGLLSRIDGIVLLQLQFSLYEITKLFFFSVPSQQVSNWQKDFMELEDRAKQTAELLFFVIDKQTRSTASMVEATYLAGMSTPS